MQGDEPVEFGQKSKSVFLQMILTYDTNQSFKNYEDSDWSKDEYEWLKNEDGTNISK